MSPMRAAPAALTARLLRQCAWRVRHQWTTMPAWDSVKARNTLTAYRWMSDSVRPPKATNITPATTASAMIRC